MMFRLPAHRYRNRRVSAMPGLRVGEWNRIMDVSGPGIIRHLWFTFPTAAYGFSRQTLLRIFWDDELEPSVCAPLGDFFALPFGFTGTEYCIDSQFIAIAPHNGLNCYFPMPFARRARIEVYYGARLTTGAFYFQADYEECLDGLPEEWKDLRFHAHYRMENPTEKYGANYLTLDAEGSGIFVGASYGIRRRVPQPDEWYHGGGDSIFIDGESHPHLLHGIGAEDYFGHSWGVAPYTGQYMGTPYFERTAPGEDGYDVVLYRFHGPDPIRFSHSIRHNIGAMGDSISSVAYWYQTEPHRPFFTLPPIEQLPSHAHVSRLHFDIPPANQDEWLVLGPFAQGETPFAETAPWEVVDDPTVKHLYSAHGPNKTTDTMTVEWQPLTAPRGFVDFHTVMRPKLRTIQLQASCYAYALGYIDCPDNCEATLQVAYDDQIRVRLNDEVILEATHKNGFAVQGIPVRLQSGRNRILIKLSNADNTTWRAWVFHLSFSDASGVRLNLSVHPT